MEEQWVGTGWDGVEPEAGAEEMIREDGPEEALANAEAELRRQIERGDPEQIEFWTKLRKEVKRLLGDPKALRDLLDDEG